MALVKNTKTPDIVAAEIDEADAGTVSNVPREEKDWTDHELERAVKREHLTTLRTNNKQREEYAKKTFKLACWWLTIVILMVIAAGFKLIILSDAVLVTLITTTTASVFGFFLLVMKYLFHPAVSLSTKIPGKIK